MSVTPALSGAIEAIWDRSLEETTRRIATLDRASAASLAGELGDELRAHAGSDAHKLAGSLGMFGLATGSELASEVEQALATSGGGAMRDAPGFAELVFALRAQVDARMAGRSADEAATDEGQSDDFGLLPGAAPVGAARMILVIDDSALIRQVVRLALTGDPGWQVRAAESGAEGVELAGSERPQAILLDVEMPELDGPGTLARLRDQEATREIPVLFLTAHCTERDSCELEALGAAGVIAKPFDPPSLASQVAGLLRWAP